MNDRRPIVFYVLAVLSIIETFVGCSCNNQTHFEATYESNLTPDGVQWTKVSNDADRFNPTLNDFITNYPLPSIDLLIDQVTYFHILDNDKNLISEHMGFRTTTSYSNVKSDLDSYLAKLEVTPQNVLEMITNAEIEVGIRYELIARQFDIVIEISSIRDAEIRIVNVTAWPGSSGVFGVDRGRTP